MASVGVHFSPGFLSGEGFSAEQCAPAWFLNNFREAGSGGVQFSAEKQLFFSANFQIILRHPRSNKANFITLATQNSRHYTYIGLMADLNVDDLP
jgi:hypothetical protein